MIALFALAGIKLAFWFVLAFLVAIQMVIGIYGHHLVQAIEKYLGYFLLVVFAITGILASPWRGRDRNPVLGHMTLIRPFVLGKTA